MVFDAAPAAAVVVTAGYLFDVPVRYDAASLGADLAFFSEANNRGTASLPSIPLIEVLGE